MSALRRGSAPRLLCALAAAVLLGPVALGAVAPAARAATFRAADNQVEDYPTVQALRFMARLVAERTGGRHRIQVFHSGQLGEERSTIEQTKRGAIDLNRVNITPLTGAVPVLNAVLLPFQFRSIAHQQAVLDGPLGEEILAKLDRAGFVGLTFYDSGARSIYNSTRPVRTLADLAGLKIRVQQSDLMLNLVTALGAQPVALPYDAVLPALQTKVVDGAENNWPSYVSTGHYLAARHITLTEHVMAPEVLLMSKRAWESLSPEDRAVFREAARESRLFMRERWRAWENENRQRAEAVSQVVTEFDREAFRRATQGLRDKYLADPEVRSMAERIDAAR